MATTSLGVPLPDFTKTGVEGVTEPVQTQDKLLEAQKAQSFAWAPDQTKQVISTLQTRSQEEAKKVKRVQDNAQTQVTKAEIKRYEQMIKDEEAKINTLNGEIATLNSEKSSLQGELTSIRGQIDSAKTQAASLRQQATQVSQQAASIVVAPPTQSSQPQQSSSTSYVGPTNPVNLVGNPYIPHDPAEKQRQIAALESRLNAVKERLIGPQLRKLEEIKRAAKNESLSINTIPPEWVEGIRIGTTGWGDDWNRSFASNVANYASLPANHRLRSLVEERLVAKKFNENRSFMGDSFTRPDQYDIGWDPEYKTLNAQWMALGMPPFEAYRK